MADEIINIATFEFDVSRLETSADRLQSKLFELKKEQQGYANQMKEVQKATEALVKEQLRLVEANQEESEAFKENKVLLDSLAKSEEQLFKNQQNTATSMARVRGELTQTNNQLKAYMTSTSEFTSLTDAANKALNAEIRNKNDAKVANIELNRISNQLNPAIAEEAALLKQVNAQLDNNTKFIKENSSETAKQKMNVGNYTESVREAINSSKLFENVTNALPPAFQRAVIGFRSAKETISEVKNAYTEYGKATDAAKKAQEEFNTLTKLSQSATEAATAAENARVEIGFRASKGLATQAEVQAAATAATQAQTRAEQAKTAATEAGVVATNLSSNALKLLRVALISTGIGAIVVVLGSLIAYLTTAQDGIGKLTAITRPLQAIFQGLLGVLSNLGRSLIETFSNPKKALEDLGNFVKNNLINRFKAFGVILEGIVDLDFKKILNGTAQAASGVENVIDKVSGGAKAAGKFLDEQAKKGAEIDRLTKEMEKSQLAYNAAQVAVGDALDKNNLIIKDTSKSFRERAAAARENIAIAEQNGQAEAKILQLELQRLKVQQQIKGIQNLTNADKQAEIDLIDKIDQAEDRGLETRLEYSRVLAGLEKERQEAAKKASEEAIKRAKAQQDAALKAMQTELDFFIASQGERKKSMEDQLAFDRQIMQKELDIAKAEYDAKKLTLKEYELEKLEIQNEFMAKQTSAMIANADLELELFMLRNKRIVDENGFFTEELYQQELDRINRVAEAEAAAQTKRLELGQINAQEYNLAIANIDENQRLANEAAAQEREDAKKEKQAADTALQEQIDAEAFEVSLQLQTERYNREYELEKAAAIKAGADMVKFEEAQAVKKKNIERTVQENKLQLASDTFSNLATIFGKESAAGKAAAIAQTTIDTYKGAQSAFTALSGIPIVGPVLGGIAAAAAVVSGLANVKKIVSTKEPKIDTAGVKKPSYAKGVIGIRGLGNELSDSIAANVSNGESVITARATQMFPQLLSDINQAGGGVGLDGTTSTLMQNSINQRADNSQLAEMVADAVRIGAAEGTAVGSERGLTGLADNRKIMADAKF